jgi:predicted helicase
MITNHGYLDNPTFRGMRRALMQTFNEIYVLNLHGNAKKKEVCPDGSPDENVFDIQQGVAIGIFLKQPGDSGEARIYHADLWGLREGKYQALAEMEMGSTPWQELQPTPPFYLFVPQAVDLRAEYERGWPVNAIFPVNSVGIVTARDHLTIRWSPAEVWETVNDFAGLPEEEAREKYNLGDDAQDWKVALAQADLKKSGPDQKKVAPILYRPFDVRFTYFTGQSRGFICRPRHEVMHNVLGRNNLCLIFTRSTSPGKDYDHISCSSHGILGRFYPDASCITYMSPLYLYPYSNNKSNSNNPKNQNSFLSLCEPETPYGRKVNIDPTFIKKIRKLLGLKFVADGRGDLETTFGPEDVFFYAYAVFHSPTYRQRYAQFLKGDFPRLPLTGDQALFAALVGQGAELAALHLLESPALEKLITSFPVSGSNLVEKVRYVIPPGSPLEKGGEIGQGRVYINDQQFFAGVPPEVWAFQVGGYQVLHKWLKDRKGRTLAFADLHHYQKIVVALAETIRLMAEIDAAIDAHGGWPIDK